MTWPGRSTATREWRLRTSLILLLVFSSVVSFGFIGSGVLAWRVPVILKEDALHLRYDAVSVALGFEGLLNGLEGRLASLVALDAEMPAERIHSFLEAVVAEGGFQAVYLLDRDGRVEYAALSSSPASVQSDLRGIDFSHNPLYVTARHLKRRVWSDRYLSALGGASAIGLAIPLGDHALVGEIAPLVAQDIISSGAAIRGFPILVVDRAGEVVAGRNLTESDSLRNWAGEIGELPESNEGVVRQIHFGGRLYDVGLARSAKLNWTFVVAMPAGIANPRVKATALTVAGGFLGSLLLALILAPIWASRMNAPLNALIAKTWRLKSGQFDHGVSRGPILEFNQLAADMESMAEAISQRQNQLKESEQRLLQSLQNLQQLNLELESRVERRTTDLAGANRELSQALETLKLAQAELVRSETLASLGRMVGGVAHELNTPIGNGMMAVSTVHDEVRSFRRDLESGLRRTTLYAFVDRVEQGADIAVRNLQRANELIASFKQVAVDQTSAQRRRFHLVEVVDEILLTVQPTLRRSPHRVRRKIPAALTMDSYPGPLGQVLTNLLSNAFLHGFEGRPKGRVEITAEPLEGGNICLEVSDNGAGIPPEMLARIFDPFVTSKLGRGGTGLGLHIVWNTVTVILGGSITVDSTAEHGTRFHIILPTDAPLQPAAS